MRDDIDIHAENKVENSLVALRALPAAQREVLVMKVWGGLTFPQVAEALGIPADTAASRFRYSRGKLRELLAEESIP